MKKSLTTLLLLASSISVQAIPVLPGPVLSSPVSELLNGSFEAPGYSTRSYHIVSESQVPAWQTTASDGMIEIWSNNFLGVQSFEGNQHVELNANRVGTLYQTTSAVKVGKALDFKFAHRGRSGTDVMRLTITDLGSDNVFGTHDDQSIFSKQYSTGNTEWVQYTNAGEDSILSLGNAMRFSYASILSAGGNSYGKFLDDVSFRVNSDVSAVPVPAAFWMFGSGLLGFIGIRKKSLKA